MKNYMKEYFAEKLAVKVVVDDGKRGYENKEEI